MCGGSVSWVFILQLPKLIQGVLVLPASSQGCDASTNTVPEGDLGRQSYQFPWIGMLRPIHPLQNHLHRSGKDGIMIVMVKDGFAIGVADEILRLPKYLIKGFASITFQSGGIRSYKMASFLPHPEYNEEAEEGTTVNALALLHLQPLDPADTIIGDPIIPICLQGAVSAVEVSDHLYAVLYNYKKREFEKAIYSMKYMKTGDCQDFYMKAGLTDPGFEPISLQCAHARNLPRGCVWEAGVALVSNATGPWLLMGLGTKSLGCANPTRFIDVVPYVPWIEGVAVSDSWQLVLNKRFDTRRRGQSRGRGNLREGTNEVPLEDPLVDQILQNKYPFESDADPFKIVQHSDSEIHIITVPGTYGICHGRQNELMYREETRVTAPDDEGEILYQLSLYDDYFVNVSCTRISVYGLIGNAEASIFVDDQIRNTVDVGEVGETPYQVLQTIDVSPPWLEEKKKGWAPGPPLRPVYLEEKNFVVKKNTHNVVFRLNFNQEAMLRVDVLGKDHPTTTTVAPNVTTKKGGRRYEGWWKYEGGRRGKGGRWGQRGWDRRATSPPPGIARSNNPSSNRNHTPSPTRTPTTKTRRPQVVQNIPILGRPRHYEELVFLDPQADMLRSTADPNTIQLFIVISIFATWCIMDFARIC